MSQDAMIKLECTSCKQIKYYSRKNKKVHKERLELKKFCNSKQCSGHQMMKETK